MREEIGIARLAPKAGIVVGAENVTSGFIPDADDPVPRQRLSHEVVQDDGWDADVEMVTHATVERDRNHHRDKRTVHERADEHIRDERLAEFRLRRISDPRRGEVSPERGGGAEHQASVVFPQPDVTVDERLHKHGLLIE